MLIRQIRQMDPGIGYLKLWLMMKRMFLQDWVPGRDAFLGLLRDFPCSGGFVIRPY
jgi:hypothetical protein